MMIKKMKQIPLLNKIQLFSFCMPLFLLACAAIAIFAIFSYEWKEDLTYRADSLLKTAGYQLTNAEESSTISNQDKEMLTSLLTIQQETVTNTYICLYDESSACQEWSVIHQDGTYSTVSSTALQKIYYQIGRKGVSNNSADFLGFHKENSSYFYTAFIPLTDEDDNIVGGIGMDIAADNLFHHIHKLLAAIITIFVVTAFFLFFYTKITISKYLLPLKEVIWGLQEISSGNLEVELTSHGASDIRMISESLNEMVRKLAMLFTRLSKTSKELGTLSRDIELNSVEEALNEMDNIMNYTKIHRELQRAEKMNAIGQLAASVAHEIRNPMTVVKGFLQIFLAKEHISEEERMYIKLMIEEMNRAETIINDYLSLAKPGIEQTEKIDGQDMIIKVIDLMYSYAMMSKSITFERDIQQVFLRANRSELKQVLINIVKNGIESMQQGGVLSVYLYTKEGYGIFEITDTGIGMTEEELSRLGTAFYSLKEKGTGMGLMVSYQMIEQMKGKIEVESKKGKGTTFKVFIPLY
ncbi:ATP-binding protein [Niallia taxi]|uniref:ATP-binding protein n=1 Tax=Niallia taxi TaxID=2499688 RepID=UPI003D27F834